MSPSSDREPVRRPAAERRCRVRRFSRPCYDKAHRCPGGAGGGPRAPRDNRHDCDGYVAAGRRWCGDENDYPGHPWDRPWTFGHCNACSVVTWPVMWCPSLVWRRFTSWAWGRSGW